MLPFARAALTGALGVRAAVDELAGLVRGHVAIGVVPSVGDWLAEALAGLHAGHPGVEITLREDTSDALLEEVRSGRLDLALAGLAGAVPAGLASETVSDQELVAAVAADGHPLAGRRNISLRELADETLIVVPRGTGGRAAIDAPFAGAGLAPRMAFEAGDPRVLMALAARGLGVAIVPASAPQGLSALRIRPVVRSRLELVWRPQPAPSPAARALLKHARRSLASASARVR